MRITSAHDRLTRAWLATSTMPRNGCPTSRSLAASSRALATMTSDRTTLSSSRCRGTQLATYMWGPATFESFSEGTARGIGASLSIRRITSKRDRLTMSVAIASMTGFSSGEPKKYPAGSVHAGVRRGESCAAGAHHASLVGRARLSTRVTARSRDLQNQRSMPSTQPLCQIPIPGTNSSRRTRDAIAQTRANHRCTQVVVRHACYTKHASCSGERSCFARHLSR